MVSANEYQGEKIITQTGRYVRYRIPIPADNNLDGCHLWLASNGTGHAELEGVRYEFRWDTEWSPAGIYSIGVKELIPLCNRIFKECLNPILENPFVEMDGTEPRNPIEFICGSEEDLRRITTWILQSDASLFDDAAIRTLTYLAIVPVDETRREDKPFSDAALTPGPAFEYEQYPECVSRLAEIAFEYNAFTGIYWEYLDFNFNRRDGWEAQPRDIRVQVQRPSEHEHAEALLNLADWLKGKAPNDEQKNLLGQG